MFLCCLLLIYITGVFGAVFPKGGLGCKIEYFKKDQGKALLDKLER
jgi:hypothetical protein